MANKQTNDLTFSHACDLVIFELNSLLKAKGLETNQINSETNFLESDIGIDSLDLATLIVSLEEKTGLRPFSDGFLMFKTVRDLAELFSNT